MDFVKYLKEFLNFLLNWCMTNGLRLVLCLLLLIIGLRVIKKIGKKLKTSPRFDRMDPSLRSFLSNALVMVLDAVLLITVAAGLGIPMASFVTVLASCGVAIGLALQGSLSNLAGGVMLLFFRPFKVGDYIETAAGEAGTVKDITVFYTILTTGDNKTITIPNGALTNATVTNYSTSTRRRVDLEFEVAYSTDIEQMKSLLLEEANAHALTLREPAAPFARLTRNDASAMVFVLRVWTKAEDYWTLRFDLLESVKKRLDAEGIEIPFPQLDVHTKD